MLAPRPILLALAALLLATPRTPAQTRRSPPPSTRAAKPALPLIVHWRTVDKAAGKSESLRGKLLIVVFFTPGDTQTEPALRAVQSELDALEGSGIAAVGVALTKSEDAVRDLTKTLNLSFPIHFDARTGAIGVAKSWSVKTPVEIFLLDPDAHPVFHGPPADLAAKVRDQLKLTPPRLVSRETVGEAMDALALAEARLNDGKPRSAARYLAGLPEEARKDPEVSERLAALTRSLEQALPELIEETEKLAASQKLAEAVVLLEQAAAALKDTPGEAKALDQLHSFTDDPELRPRIEAGRPQALAADLLDSAAEFEESSDLVSAYHLCQAVIEKYPDTAAAKEARAKIADWESTPARKRSLRDALYGQPANALLSQAENYRRSNLTEKARGFLQQILDKYPDTTAAEKAAKLLKEIK